MGKGKGSQPSTERRNWDKIFNGLTQMLQTQQKQLETLVKERKLLEDRVRMQHDRWVSDSRLYEDHISQMKDELLLKDMERSLDASKSYLITGMKQTEASLWQLKIELSESELEEFKSFLHLVSKKCSHPSEISLRSASKTAEEYGGIESDMKSYKYTGEERRSKELEGEVRRLRCEYEKLASEKRSEVSALMAEKKFVWNQFNVLENNYTSKLRSKHSELELANQKIEKLLVTLEQLQSSSNEKDDIIATLENQVGKMEIDSSKLKEEISKLSHELEVQRKSTNGYVIPVLNRCMERIKTSSLAGKNSSKARIKVIVNEDTSSVQTFQSGSLKRRGADVVSDSGTPRLFSSNFKVPKLKNQISPFSSTGYPKTSVKRFCR